VVAIFAKKKLIAVFYQFNVKLHISRSSSIAPTKADERILAPPWFGGWGLEFYAASGKLVLLTLPLPIKPQTALP
jgi:hypothetical protein